MSYKNFSLIFIILLLVGCSDPVEEQRKILLPIAAEQIDTLNKKLQNKELGNVLIIHDYAKKLERINPEYSDVTRNFLEQIAPNGKDITEFKNRLNRVHTNPESFDSKEDALMEVNAIVAATNPEVYNDSLVDVVNTIAALSDGRLQKVQTSFSAHGAHNAPGSSLVGNPKYGSWEERNGNSVWMWFAAYMVFDRLSNRPYYYHNWYYNRPWSYHHDYGRRIYSSPSQARSDSQLRAKNDRKLKQYGKDTNRNMSSYQTKSNNNFRPSASTRNFTRNSSSFSGSHRSGSRSRGIFSGK